MDRLLRCVKKDGADVIDLLDTLQKAKAQDPIYFKSLFNGHMTAAGNHLVAERIYDAMSP